MSDLVGCVTPCAPFFQQPIRRARSDAPYLTNGAFHFSDPTWTNYPARNYRIRSP